MRSRSSSRSRRGDCCDQVTPVMKRRRGSRRVIKKDLLSSLPESMICHIFSFMPIQDIVRTSVLSKSWRFMCYKTTAISFPRPNQLHLYHFNIERFYPDMDRVLAQCTSSTIRKFHLLRFRYHPSTKEKLELWLQFALGRRVEDLHLGLDALNSDSEEVIEGYDLPNTLFQCQSVVKLHLSFCNFSLVYVQSYGINWTSLKFLHVENTKVRDDVFNEILNGSPLLEHLELIDCEGMKNLRVHSRKLRELVIDGYGYTYLRYHHNDNEDDEQADIGVSKLVISVPHLQVLRLLGYWDGKRVINLDNVSSLVECELNLELVATESYKAVVCDMLKKLFHDKSRVNKLIIGTRFLLVLPTVQLEAGYFLPTECRNLLLRTALDEQELAGIAELLKCTLSVENLVFDLSIHNSFWWNFHNEKHPSRLRLMESISLLNRLKSVKVFGFRDHNEERCLSLISMLLKGTLTLQEMVINITMQLLRNEKKSVSASRVWWMLDVARKVMQYERGCSACKVILNYPFMKKSYLSHLSAKESMNGRSSFLSFWNVMTEISLMCNDRVALLLSFLFVAARRDAVVCACNQTSDLMSTLGHRSDLPSSDRGNGLGFANCCSDWKTLKYVEESSYIINKMINR